MKTLRRISNERGAVMVLTAAALFPMVFLMAFAIDVSHWFDYSRNLQNRADAAALAAGIEFGNICLEGGNPGDVVTGAQSSMGKFAQLYSGAGTGEPSGATTTQLPYTNAAVAAATGWNVSTNGYLNNTLPPSPLISPLTLKLGSLNSYWLVLNGKDYAENGGTSFSMMPGGTGATFCSSDPTQDLTDPNRATAGPAGPMVDVKVSQKRLPLFFPVISGRPTLHAHARVELQGEASSPSEPIAVSDTGTTPCLSVDLVNATTNAVIQTVTLTKKTPVNPTDPITWDNVSAPASFTMPASANVYLQPFLNNCNGSGQRYDGDTNTGILYINNHPQTDPTVNPDQQPQLTSGGVTVSGGPCPSNTTQYFSIGGCTVTVDANVSFATNVTPQSKRKVFVVDHTWDNVNNVWVTGNPVKLPNVTGDHYAGNITVPDQSGIHELEITWEEDNGTVGGVDCSGPTPAACMGTFGIQAQVFGACNGCDQPDDSGPIIFARISEGGSNDVNSFAGNSPHNLVITLQLAGLSAAHYPDPAVVLRFPVSGNHQTGLVDCGQGGGTGADAYVVYYGCGPGNPHFSPPLNPLFVNTRDTCGTPPGPPWPNGNQQDCVQTTPGTRRQNIICPLVLRIVGAPFDTNCNNNAVGNCPDNNWNIKKGNVSGTEARAVTMIITSAVDLGAGGNNPQLWIPIRRFATFYITGWDKNIKPQCPGNDTFPGTGKTSQNGAVWGHWMNYTDPNGIPNGQGCPVNSVQPINCVPVLTR